MSALIRLPETRYEQVVKLAEHHHQSIADCLGDLIARELERVGIDGTVGIPPFELRLLPTGEVHFGAPFGNYTWTPEIALSLASSLDAVAAIDGKPGGVLDFDSGLKILRRGRSVELADAESSGASMRIAPSIAREIAQSIRKLAI